MGHRKFFTETGIKESDWRGVYWARWNDAVREAGLSPNQKTTAYDDEWLLLKLITYSRELGRFPVQAELRIKARTAEDFPWESTFQKLGTKEQVMAKVAGYCRAHEGFADVLAMCEQKKTVIDSPDVDDQDDIEMGFVYLLRSGRFYKIGRSNACGRRARELAIQLPEKADLVHQIRADDPAGIEAYWHRRFESQRKNGEWFDLSAADIKVFRRRRFM